MESELHGAFYFDKIGKHIYEYQNNLNEVMIKTIMYLFFANKTIMYPTMAQNLKTKFHATKR
jgi:hypothetical protein